MMCKVICCVLAIAIASGLVTAQVEFRKPCPDMPAVQNFRINEVGTEYEPEVRNQIDGGFIRGKVLWCLLRELYKSCVHITGMMRLHIVRETSH